MQDKTGLCSTGYDLNVYSAKKDAGQDFFKNGTLRTKQNIK